jgi:acetyl-CoA carboxylase carboxyl transferase subunit alpha
MPAETLDFEEPVALLLKEIEALRMMPQTPERWRRSRASRRGRGAAFGDFLEAGALADRAGGASREPAVHARLRRTPDYGLHEVHGDRRFADDTAIISGFGFYHGEAVMVVGHQKGRDTKQKIYRNFGYAKPEGYRKPCA